MDQKAKPESKQVREEKPMAPLVIELAGTPNAGKDTQILYLTEYLRQVHHLKVCVLNEAYTGSRSRIGDLEPFDRFMGTIPLICNDLFWNIPPDFDVVFVNRGLFDLLGYLRYYRKKRKLDKEKEEIISGFITQKAWLKKTDIVLLLIVDPAISVRREEEQQLKAVQSLMRLFDWDQGRIRQTMIQPDELALLNQAFQEVETEQKGKFPHFYTVENAGVEDRREISEAILRKIGSQIRQRYRKFSQPRLPGVLEA